MTVLSHAGVAPPMLIMLSGIRMHGTTVIGESLHSAQLPLQKAICFFRRCRSRLKGLAVVSFTGSQLELDPSYRASNQFVAPVHVKGTKPFRLLATWDHNDRAEGLNRRPGPLLRALEDSANFAEVATW